MISFSTSIVILVLLAIAVIRVALKGADREVSVPAPDRPPNKPTTR
jgi:hypothetical protein